MLARTMTHSGAGLLFSSVAGCSFSSVSGSVEGMYRKFEGPYRSETLIDFGASTLTGFFRSGTLAALLDVRPNILANEDFPPDPVEDGLKKSSSSAESRPPPPPPEPSSNISQKLSQFHQNRQKFGSQGK
uniref:Putative secreted protein n=1 Tax=Anopheles darlingi TaxID=43151 RepID=A0A2M4DJR5_ANODA